MRGQSVVRSVQPALGGTDAGGRMRRSWCSWMTVAAISAAVFAVVGGAMFEPRLASAGPATQPVDVIVSNDLLCVGIWDNRPTGGETLKTVRVDPQGFISLYYIGQLKVSGLTFEQAE